MATIITCPFSWGRTMIKTGGAGDNEIRLGYGSTTYGAEFHPILKFDLRNLAGKAPSKIESVSLKMYATLMRNITTMQSSGFEILRDATTGATWNTYNGSNPWTTPGAGASGSDYYQDQLGTRLWASIGYSTMQINPETFKLLWANDHALVLKPTSGRQTGEDLELVEFSNSVYPPYLEVTIRAGSSYVMIF